MKFKDFINESSVITYHGDDFDTKKIEAKLMMTDGSNNQEGIGVYFGSLETAETYGKDIVSAKINPKNFVDSRKDIGKYIKISQMVDMLTDMWKSDEETMYYMITDWGLEISEPEDIEQEHMEYLANNMQSDEVRNFQITLAEQFGVVTFVDSWNTHCKNIHGTCQKQGGDEVWYCIINTKIKLKKEN